MVKLSRLLIISVLSFAFATPYPTRLTPPPGFALESFEPLNTKAFDCNGQSHELRWHNTNGGLWIRRAEIWYGMYAGGVADFNAWLGTSSGIILARGNWDHYADPTGITDQILSEVYAPDYIELGEGESLVLNYGCSALTGATKAHLIVTIWIIRRTKP